MEEQSKEKSSMDKKCTYKGYPIKEYCWFAVVEKENGSVMHIDSFVEHARDVLNDEILPDEEFAWRSAHPNYNAPEVPADVREAIAKRFMIVSCDVTIAPGAEIWRSEQ